MKHIIAFSGFAGSGKDTAAKYLKEIWAENGPILQVKFAGTFKHMLGVLLESQGVPVLDTPRYIEGDLKELPTEYLNGKTPREAMLTLGSEWGRHQISESFWADVLIRQIKNNEVHSHFVITDLRFENELEKLQEAAHLYGWDVTTVKIVREGVGQRILHESEQFIEKMSTNVTIHNDGSLEDLKEEIAIRFEGWGK